MKEDIRIQKFEQFLSFFKKYIKGSEKGEGQIFFEKLLQAFGNAGVREVGASCEELIKKKGGKIGFADFTWEPRVIIELKKRGEALQQYYDQALDYWIHRIPRLQYMILCNFDTFWIYDLNQQLDPVHKLNITDLPNNWGPLAFLFPKPEKPTFQNHNIAVTKEVASKIGNLYYSLVKRGIKEDKAQRFILQTVVALFSEDVGLIPKYTVHNILSSAGENPDHQKKLKSLLLSMACNTTKNKPTKHKQIPFFNGGLFEKVEIVRLSLKEIHLLYKASAEDWSKVRPSIFGSIFEANMNKVLRHGHGIHYTSELDIQKIVYPTIVKPFKKEIKKSNTKKALRKVLSKIREFKVLDPACGSGNFLYIAFRELRRLEMEVLEKLGQNLKQIRNFTASVSPKNFYGIDTNKFGLELAKVALSVGRKLSADEFNIQDPSLPFDDLDDNFLAEDSLFVKWPKVDVIIGNPPYLSSKKMKIELPVEYIDQVRQKFKEVPGRADYCVYWFRKAHDHLKIGQRAGLVGTNTIRENYSREGGLDYIVKNKGVITEAISTQVWSGSAKVHVSIVNWIKGRFEGKKKLFTQTGNQKTSPWKIETPKHISSSLSSKISVKNAHILQTNRHPKRCFVGQALQSAGFRLSKDKYQQMIKKNKKNIEVIFPFFTGREYLHLKAKKRFPKRFMIDFSQLDILSAKKYKEPFDHIQKTVLPDVKQKAKNEIKKHGKAKDWNNHLNYWWRHWRSRPDLTMAVSKIKKYIVVSRTVKAPIVFEFISSAIRIADAVIGFNFEDNYSFGILQSSIHLEWVKSCCGTLGGSIRYTGDTVFSTFPWPQNPTPKQVKKISTAVQYLMQIRKNVMHKNNWGLRELYNTLSLEGKNPLKDAHNKLDEVVRLTYGMNKKEDTLKFLLNLNRKLHTKEEKGLKIVGPGVPPSIKNSANFISKDCITNC